MAKHVDSSRRHAIISDLARIVDLYGNYMRPFMESIVAALRDYWLPTTEVKPHTDHISEVARLLFHIPVKSISCFRDNCPFVLVSLA